MMKSLIIGIATAAVLTGGACLAQTTQNTTPNATTPNATMQNDRGATSGDNRAAASGDNNQAVATTDQNAPGPAKGANSFTMNEAKSRLEKNGFSNVSDLQKDDNGVWRGKGEKNGSTGTVWLDYKGNAGMAQQ
jgi:hypothetical protein